MERLVQDLTYGARLLWRHKGFTLTVVATLAVAIAANAAIFSIVNAVVLRPLPFRDASRLVMLFNAYPKAGFERASNAVPDYYDRQKAVPALTDLALFNTRSLTIGGAGDAERVAAAFATPSLFRLLDVKMLRGRAFNEDEGQVGHEHRVILSHALWQRRFGGQDRAIGSDLRVNGEPYTVVGVLPADFHFVLEADDPLVWVPAAFTPEQKSDDARHSNNYDMIGRLRPGATLEQARQQVDALNAANLDRFPAFKDIVVNAGFTTKVVPLRDDLVRNVAGTLYLLWAGAAFVLLIAVLNVANLVLARANSRLKELATRHVLGAGSGRLAQQLVTETTFLALAAGALGLLLGDGIIRAVTRVGLERLPRISEVHLDWTVAAYTLGISVLLGVLLGVVPIVGIRRNTLNQAFREEGRTSTGGRRARTVRRALVVSEVAAALVLLAGAGLLLTSFRHVLAVDPGFKPSGVLTARLTLPAAAYADDGALRSFTTRLLERARAIPGVTAAGVSTSLPFASQINASAILAEGYQMAPGESLVAPFNVTASDGFFDALQVPLRRGRYFDRRDTGDSQAVVIVDEKLARRFWPNADPIGKRMYSPDKANSLEPGPDTRFLTVVGVVGELKYVGLAPIADIDPAGACYFAAAQQPIRNLVLSLRASTAPGGLVTPLRRVVTALDAELPLFDVKTMQERIDLSLANRRTPMWLALGFAGVALFLAGIGIYGVLAYQVTQRTREIGVRMALGGGTSEIFGLFVRDGMVTVAVGLAIGLVATLALGRALQSQLFGVSATDPAVIGLVGIGLAVVGLAASVIPAVRATRVNPVTALMDL